MVDTKLLSAWIFGMCRDRLVVFPLSFLLGFIPGVVIRCSLTRAKKNSLLVALKVDTLEVHETLEQVDIESPSEESTSPPRLR